MTGRAKSVRTLTGRPECAHHWLTHVLAETFLSTVLLYGMVGYYSQELSLIQCDIPSHFSHGQRLFGCKRDSTRVISNLHDTHQLTDFIALTELLQAITEPSDVLHTHYACRTSTRHINICDPFTYLQEKKIVAMTYAPSLV
ncbi:hypothetical protein TNCV_1909961 [Trichonephila clavipes]|nr:hypothetical protein TNCV_1909961 [Trichonephila clavipes]